MNLPDAELGRENDGALVEPVVPKFKGAAAADVAPKPILGAEVAAPATKFVEPVEAPKLSGADTEVVEPKLNPVEAVDFGPKLDTAGVEDIVPKVKPLCDDDVPKLNPEADVAVPNVKEAEDAVGAPKKVEAGLLIDLASPEPLPKVRPVPAEAVKKIVISTFIMWELHLLEDGFAFIVKPLVVLGFEPKLNDILKIQSRKC